LHVHGETHAVAPVNPVPPHCSHCFACFGAVVVVVAGTWDVVDDADDEMRLLVMLAFVDEDARVLLVTPAVVVELAPFVVDVTNVVPPLPPLNTPFATKTPLPLVPT
jgi:hypothetical protein